MSSIKKIAYIHAMRTAAPHTPKGALEKVIGKLLSEQYGITDAPQDLFVEVKATLEASAKELGIEVDVKDPDLYPPLNQAVAEAVTSMGYI